MCIRAPWNATLGKTSTRFTYATHWATNKHFAKKNKRKKIFMRVTHGIHAIRIVHGYTTTIHSGVCVICGARIRASSFYMYVPCVSCRIRLNRFRTKLLALRRRLAIVSETLQRQLRTWRPHSFILKRVKNRIFINKRFLGVIQSALCPLGRSTFLFK